MSHVSAGQVCTWHSELAKLEEQIDALHEKKKLVYERIRRDFDRRTAEGMNAAMKYLRMDERKGTELFGFSDLGRTFITLVEKGEGVADAWRVEREQERATPFPINHNATSSTIANTH